MMFAHIEAVTVVMEGGGAIPLVFGNHAFCSNLTKPLDEPTPGACGWLFREFPNEQGLSCRCDLCVDDINRSERLTV